MVSERLNARPLSTMIARSTGWQLVGIVIGGSLAIALSSPSNVWAALAGCFVGQATAGAAVSPLVQQGILMSDEFPTPVLLELLNHFDPSDILAAEQGIGVAEAISPYRPSGREYWDEQIWRIKDALFRLQHPSDPNPFPRLRLWCLGD